MKTANFMATTALVAVLAGPVVAQTDNTQSADQQGQIGSYAVGEFLSLFVRTSDGEEAGQVLAVIEGEEGAQVVVSLDDKSVVLPLGAFEMAEGGEALIVDRSMSELEEMDAFEVAGEMELDPNTMASDAMGDTGTGSGMTNQGQETETAEGGSATTEELDTTVVEDTAEDVTVITTNRDAVETDGEGESRMTEGEDAASGDDRMQRAEGDATAAQPDDEAVRLTEGDGTAADEGDDTLMSEETDGTRDPSQDTGQSAVADSGAEADDAGRDIAAFIDVSVGDIRNMDVIGANGNDVGEIDYVFQSDSGEYQAVIGIGGFLGLGEHTVALPLSAFSMGPEADTLMLDGYTEDELGAMQEVDESGLTGLPDDHVISDV